MRVLCQREPGKFPDENESWLEKGKEYIVMMTKADLFNGFSYCLMSKDKKKLAWFSVNGFEVLSQEIPSTWITAEMQVQGNSALIMLPEKWHYDSFLSDLNSGEKTAQEIFEAETRKMYKEEEVEF